MEKIKELFLKITSSEKAIKRIPFYFFLICILLIVLIFKIEQTNKLLYKIAYNNKGTIAFEKVEPDKVLDEKYNYDKVIPAINDKNKDTFDKLNNFENENIESTSKINTNASPSPSERNEQDLTESTSNKIEEVNDDIKRTYIINVTSKKMHAPDCSSAKKIKDDNKEIIKLTNSELNDYLENGYTLCKACGGKSNENK